MLRSIASICALASCGLAVPASSASLPFVDAVVLRTFLGDSQVDGQSAFAVEMNHMASVLKTATNNSLVLVDELGKGTEVCVGASLCASMLKALAVRGCKGLFATHFHHLVDFFHGNQIGVKPMQMMAEMKGATQNGSLPYDVKMHWRLVEGKLHLHMAASHTLKHAPSFWMCDTSKLPSATIPKQISKVFTMIKATSRSFLLTLSLPSFQAAHRCPPDFRLPCRKESPRRLWCEPLNYPNLSTTAPLPSSSAPWWLHSMHHCILAQSRQHFCPPSPAPSPCTQF